MASAKKVYTVVKGRTVGKKASGKARPFKELQHKVRQSRVYACPVFIKNDDPANPAAVDHHAYTWAWDEDIPLDGTTMTPAPDYPVVPCGKYAMPAGVTAPKCATHNVSFVLRRKTPSILRWEAVEKSLFEIAANGTIMFQDVASRGTAQCRLCGEKIAKGDNRVGFHCTRRAEKQSNGGYVAYSRYYLHRSCFIDKLFGGSPGVGCPGCTAKMHNDEFRNYRKMLEKRANV